MNARTKISFSSEYKKVEFALQRSGTLFSKENPKKREEKKKNEKLKQERRKDQK
jgi:hypothetical protein